MFELLPVSAAFEVKDDVRIDIVADSPLPPAATLRLTHLGVVIAEAEPPLGESVSFGTLEEGGYGVLLCDGDEVLASTALQVLGDTRQRLRYGFVASYAPDKDVEAVARLARKLHLNGIQFYDWAYRHADLVGGGETYLDPLDQPISLETVRRLIRALAQAGSRSFGYAAVYGVGNEDWDQWKDAALMQCDGTPYELGGFLQIVDPAARAWLTHFISDLQKCVEQVGFQGFHLDQYGYPKYATRADGELIDLSQSFTKMINAARDGLPDTVLVFNNVNDFPTWATAGTPQDAVYIEPWAPITTLGALAGVASRARSVAQGKPVVLAAYQSVYSKASAEESEQANKLTMATLFSHGATQLLAGEGGNVLVDPYYVNNHQAADGTLEMLKRWYDFLVEHDEILMDPCIAEVTDSFAGPLNEDVEVAYDNLCVTEDPAEGAVWRRVTTTRHGLVVHLINLVGQKDTLWDGPKRSGILIEGGRLTLRCCAGRTPRVFVADPDGSGHLEELRVHCEGAQAKVDLPPLQVWQVLRVIL